VIVEKTGLVLTAAHVAQRASTDCEVILLDGTRVPARALGLNRNLDAALIQIAKPGSYPTVEMAPKESIKAGQWCVATGHPGGVEKGRKPVLRLGRILETGDSVLVSDCTLVGGDSGGPLFDANGRVIGIHSRIGGMLTANLHVPIDGFHRCWERLAASEEWGHLPGQAPFIGVRGAAEEAVARITEVFPETPAERAGLKPGDVVLKLGGEMVTNFASLTELIGRSSPGENLAIVVRRGDERLELRIVIGKR
jgi:serine protease Do